MHTVTALNGMGAPVGPIQPQPTPAAPKAAPNKQTSTIETPVAAVSPEVKETKKEELPSPQLEAQARKEREMRAQMRQIQAEKQALQEMKAEIESAKAWKSRLSQDPWSVLLESGMTPEQVTQTVLNQPKPEDIEFQKLRAELQQLKTAQDQSSKRMEEAQAQQYEQAKKQIGNEVRLLVEGDSTFETIKEMNAQEAVVELLEQTFHEQGFLMSVEEAAREVEEYLVEEALRIAQIKKVQSRLNPPQVEPTREMKSPQPQTQKSQIQTLSNRMVQSTQPLSSKERRERAILAFQGKL